MIVKETLENYFHDTLFLKSFSLYSVCSSISVASLVWTELNSPVVT